MPLKPDQEELANRAIRKLKDKRRVAVQLSTGGGKTWIFCAITKRFVEKNPGDAVLVLVHRKELLKQTRLILYNEYGIDPFLIVQGVKYIPPAKVYIGMAESVNRRLAKLPKNIKLIFIDECHEGIFKKLHNIFTTQYIFGFSATPISSSKKDPLKNYYDDIVCGPPIKWLIANKRLAQNITRAPKDIVDRSKITIDSLTGEYNEHETYQAFSKPRYVDNTVLAYEKWCKGEKTIVFNVNKEHNKQVCEAFIKAGYNAKYIDSSMGDKERDSIFHWLNVTDDAILCNVGIATTGFDCPLIRNVIFNKITASLTLWIQCDGRGGRYIADFKSSFNIIDMGGNAVTFGDWDDERDWVQMFWTPPKPGKPGIAPSKVCPKCEGIVPAGTMCCRLPLSDGTTCGYIWDKKSIAVEDLIPEFVIVTKNIDVQKIINENAHKKDYFTFFKIGEDLVKKAKETISEISDESFNFIVEKYYELGKEWAKKIREKNAKDPDKKRIAFNDWHKAKAKELLLNGLKKAFPKWETDITVEIPESTYFRSIGLPND